MSLCNENSVGSTRQSVRYYLPKLGLEQLVKTLHDEGYTVIAPRVHDDVIRMQPIQSADQIARGVRDQQEGGRYRLTPDDDRIWFDYTVGPDSPRRFFFPPEQRLFSLTVKGEAFEVTQSAPQAPKLAFIGVRACDLAAMAIQDRVFGVATDRRMYRCESDSFYRRARQQSLMIAVNCTRPGGTCFCDSMNTGPEAREGFDLALTELKGGFVVKIGSPKGQALIDKLPARGPTESEVELADLKMGNAVQRMGRTLTTEGLAETLAQAVEHPHWNEVAKRCLSCANCTLVCPTCFCSTVLDSNDLATGEVSRTRYWGSCYTHQFTFTTAGPTRTSIRGRYRHWMRHKLSTWWEQFGVSGCVGCGRCITWCPVGIDITEEAAAIQDGAMIGAAADTGSGVGAPRKLERSVSR